MCTFDSSHDRSTAPHLDPSKQQIAKVAKELPAIGWERGVAAAHVFPSIRAMINATEREWQEVPGVGKVIAKSIVRTVNGQ